MAENPVPQATITINAPAQNSHPKDFDVENMVSKPTWKQILLELIDKKKIDPWDVNIVKLCQEYLKKIKELKTLELMVPANVILAASILLRYKSDYLKIQEESVQFYSDEPPQIFVEDMPELTFSSRIPPKMQITAAQLMEEMDKIIKYENIVRIPKQRGGIDTIINMKLDDKDIERKMNEILIKIKDNIDSEGITTFSQISKNAGARDMIYTLVSILHLTQKEYVDIKQDEIFGEVFIFVLNKEKFQIQ
ncbi:MAG: segregation/condensation protein A [Candidatus Micrarchaeota archaeon]